MSDVMTIRPADQCRFDVLTIGEVMLRLDPGEGRVRTARTFRVSEGGGEYNVGRALRRCFGQRAVLVTAIGDNEVGRLLEDLLLQGGVDLDHVVWKSADDVGRHHRTPLNFTERWLRRAQSTRGVRPCQLRDRHPRARRRRLGSPLRRTRRALAPHRWHLRRPLRVDLRGCPGGDGRRSSTWDQGVLRHQLSPQLVAGERGCRRCCDG